MRTNDRTLLASLGFADPDKRDHRHDLACQWIAVYLEPKSSDYKLISAELEYVITKGEGKYSSHVGFIDVLLKYEKTKFSKFVGRLEGWADCLEGDEGATLWIDQVSVAVEVKINRVSINECLRQIKLYRQYVKPTQWLLATGFPLSDLEIRLLNNEGITHKLLDVEGTAEAPKVPSHEGQEASQPLTLF